MKQLLVTTLITLLLVAPLPAQERSASVPSELQESWARFAELWVRADFPGVAPQLVADFALLAPGGSYRGHTALEADWPRARAHAGSRYLPSNFVTDGERILETGRAQLAFTRAAEVAADEPMCVPEEGQELQPAIYLREWVRSPDGAWKVKSIVLH